MNLAALIITTAKEVNLAKRCIESAQVSDALYDIVVVSPDKELEDYCDEHKLQFVRDEGKGKIAAMNKALEEVVQPIVIWTDGDCTVENVNLIVKAFEDMGVGAVGGAVFPAEKEQTKWAFFHRFLTSAANDARRRRVEKGKFIELSGYLWAFKKMLVTEIPYDTAEDSVVPLAIFRKGYKVAYVPDAKVYVYGPQNAKDWFSQKARAAKAHEKLKKVKGTELMKTWQNEIKEGIFYALKYPYKNIKERFWLLELMFMRARMWMMLRRKSAYSDNWERVESTKR